MIRQATHARILPFAKYRRFTAAAYQSVRHKQMIHGLVEIDVTRPRAALRAHKTNSGESLSFTAFLALCLAKAVDEHKVVQALRLGSKRLVVFDDVDVYTVIEHDAAGDKYIIPYILRAANRKTVHELHHEIRAAQSADVTNVVERSPLRYLPTILLGPGFRAFTWMARRYPRLWKDTAGTVGISAVGMFGNGAGWGIPAATPTPLMLTVGGIGAKIVTIDGRIATRQYLSLTISVDHDIVDGAPAARFAGRLKELIESGYGLDDLAVESEATPSSAEVNYVYNS
jgi:pyruvate/2-oxoglutarate dehydrogenase complex dihydrolipoamide acyltransferase (E2) component